MEQAADDSAPPRSICLHHRCDEVTDAPEEVGIDMTADPAPTQGPSPTAVESNSGYTSTILRHDVQLMLANVAVIPVLIPVP